MSETKIVEQASRKLARLTLCSLLAATLKPAVSAASTQMLVPAYFDPSVGTDWNTLIASVSPQVPITAIMNPNSGPVAAVDAAYTSAIGRFQNAGGKVVAYVHSTYGNRPLADVENEVAVYQSQYGNINGIFVDEMDNTAGNLPYYQALYAYIRNRNPAWQVIGNPGSNTVQAYLSPTPAASVLVTFEHDTGYSKYATPTWEAGFSAGNFANIAYAVPSVATMRNDIALAPTHNAGSIYVTDAGGVNPYNRLPSYWAQEVSAVGALNAAKPGATYLRNGSGDFNSPANWSAPTPNGIGAEADFLNAISAPRTVFSDVPTVLGKIVFDNTNSYVLAGAGSLTMQTAVGSAIIDARRGTHKVTLPMMIASDTVLNADTGATLVIAAPVVVNSGQSLSEAGAGTIIVLSTITVQPGGLINLLAGNTVNALSLGGGASANIVSPASAAPAALELGQFSLQPSSRLNVQNSDLIIHNGDLSAVTSAIQTGFNGSTGLTSTANASPVSLKGLGALLDADMGTGSFTNFDAKPVVASDVIVKYTYRGDANLDGAVTGTDYSLLDLGFQNGLTGWYNGDFNYDGRVDGSDFTLIDNAFNAATSGPPAAVSTSELSGTAAANVPEPVASVWVLAGVWARLALRRRRSL